MVLLRATSRAMSFSARRASPCHLLRDGRPSQCTPAYDALHDIHSKNSLKDTNHYKTWLKDTYHSKNSLPDYIHCKDSLSKN